jgi:hypothetical protein
MISTWNFFMLLTLSALLFARIRASEEEQARYVKKGKVKPRKNNKGSPSVKITIPNSFFDESIGRDWKSPAQLDPALVRTMNRRRGWKDVAWAQYGEDMWLVEKYFYGMKNGVVIESGALDGVLYSNSNVFEAYLNWTAILIGKMLNFNRLASE